MAGTIMRQVAANSWTRLRQIATNPLPPFAAFFSGCLLLPGIGRGWCLNQMTGFPIPESRYNFSSAERIEIGQLDVLWVDDVGWLFAFRMELAMKGEH